MDAALDWVQDFRRRHGRAPRILHIGNVANNAYLNAKFLNARGFDCDVICHDYRHIMACPEWEDAEFQVAGLDHNAPDWHAANARGFERPSWFVQGPQVLCLDYLLARRTGRASQARRLWRELAGFNGTASPESPGLGERLGLWWNEPGFAAQKLRTKALAAVRKVKRIAATVVLQPDGMARLRAGVRRRAGSVGTARHLFVERGVLPAVLCGAYTARVVARPFLAGAIARLSAQGGPPADPAARRMRETVELFGRVFPERPDQLTMDDCASYHDVIERWRELFGHYDVVQAYATCVAFPLLAQVPHYVGFEHGTLRDFTLPDNAISRLTALGFQQARHVLITNGDCVDYARKIKVARYSPLVHPVDEARIAGIAGDPDGLHRQFGARFLFLCPLRHDWAIKGTDKYIRALPLLAAEIGRDFRVLMTRWGSQVEESVRLAEDLGVLDLIAWIEPLNRSEMIRLQKSVDVVFDQIALPHFGATAPQAIAAGVPVIMSYDPAFTRWIIPEPAPVLTAWTTQEILAGVRQALDPAWRAGYAVRAADWYGRFHSSDAVVHTLSRIYREVIDNPAIPKDPA